MENVSTEVEELEGCMCEYIDEKLKDRITALAERTELYTAQVATLCLEMGLALLNHQAGLNKPKAVHGEMKMKKIRKGKLSGAGV